MRFVFGFLASLIRFATRCIFLVVVLVTLAAGGFIYFEGSQPMHISQVPAGMTYWEFLSDRLDAAREVEPARCGVGRLVTFAFLAPVYSAIYTDIGLHPGGFLDRVSQDDANIPTGVAGTPWYRVPDVWWDVVEHISWSMLARHTPACSFRPIETMANE